MDAENASPLADQVPGASSLERSQSAPAEGPFCSASPAAHERAGTSALLDFMARRVSGTVWTTDAELRFTSSFGAGLQELNLQPHQAVGRSLYEYFGTTDDAFPAIAAHRRALAGEAVDFEIRWTERHFQTRVEPLRDDAGRIIGCAGYARDVTEHEQLTEALRASERQYRQLAESTTDYVFIVDRQGRLQYVNRSGRNASACRRRNCWGRAKTNCSRRNWSPCTWRPSSASSRAPRLARSMSPFRLARIERG